MVTKYNIILLVYESSVHEKIQPLHGPKERCRPLVLRKMYQMRDVYSRGTYYIHDDMQCHVFYIITFLNAVS